MLPGAFCAAQLGGADPSKLKVIPPVLWAPPIPLDAPPEPPLCVAPLEPPTPALDAPPCALPAVAPVPPIVPPVPRPPAPLPLEPQALRTTSKLAPTPSLTIGFFEDCMATPVPLSL